MEDNKILQESSIPHIKSEEDLPSGSIISFVGDELEQSEKARKEIIAWDVSQKDKKLMWVLAIKKAFGANTYMQLIKDAESKGYKVIKKALIEPNVLNELYDKRTFRDNQKATSDESIVIGMFEVILVDALAQNVSDIHIEIRNVGGIIRMRKNGEMMEYRPNQRMTYNEANNLCTVIYNVLASTKSVSFDPRDCQQGAVNYTVKDQELKLRFQSVPAYPEGYDVILRVLPIGRSEEFTPLQKLGYTEQQVDDIIKIAAHPVGSLTIAGVTGSGKSTTLKNLLMFINANTGYRQKIFSIEDPPEYNIAKITQIPVVIPKDFDSTKTSPFEKPIKACMRADPDIIMIGEVRDKITGDLTKKAIQSGHQVLTTVHATSAIGVIDRYIDFSLSRSVLGSPDFLSGLIYQKLLPRVCTHCSVDFNNYIQNDSEHTYHDVGLFKKIASIVGDPSEYPIKMRGKGCEHCGHSGIIGQTVCAEVITVDLEMMQLILDGKTVDLIRYWRNSSDRNPASDNMRGKTCMEHAFQKMLKGIVSPHDVESAFKPLEEMLMVVKNVNHKETDEKEKQGKLENQLKDNGWSTL